MGRWVWLVGFDVAVAVGRAMGCAVEECYGRGGWRLMGSRWEVVVHAEACGLVEFGLLLARQAELCLVLMQRRALTPWFRCKKKGRFVELLS